ncbi:hypothetical protein BH23THE1_BH23THE1_32470 [soil metagenome]
MHKIFRSSRLITPIRQSEIYSSVSKQIKSDHVVDNDRLINSYLWKVDSNTNYFLPYARAVRRTAREPLRGSRDNSVYLELNKFAERRTVSTSTRNK